MSNNYVQFSASLALSSEEERQWLRQQLDEVCLYQLPDGSLRAVTEDEPEPEGGGVVAEAVPRFFAEAYRPAELNAEPAMCQYELRPDEFWVYSEESDDPEPPARLVQLFLRKFAPSKTWFVTFATTCDKPRVDEFGGGAVFVTAEEISWVNGYQWAEEQQARFEALGGHDHWTDHSHPDLGADDWRQEVACDDTRLGYHDWVLHKLEIMKDEERATNAENV
jgi:hypothetical protein